MSEKTIRNQSVNYLPKKLTVHVSLCINKYIFQHIYIIKFFSPELTMTLPKAKDHIINTTTPYMRIPLLNCQSVLSKRLPKHYSYCPWLPPRSRKCVFIAENIIHFTFKHIIKT